MLDPPNPPPPRKEGITDLSCLPAKYPWNKGRAILAAACVSTKLEPEQILGRGRYKVLVLPRFAIYDLLHKEGWSYSGIGRFMNRDPKTVRHGVERAKHDRRVKPYRDAIVEHLRALHGEDK